MSTSRLPNRYLVRIGLLPLAIMMANLFFIVCKYLPNDLDYIVVFSIAATLYGRHKNCLKGINSQFWWRLCDDLFLALSVQFVRFPFVTGSAGNYSCALFQGLGDTFATIVATSHFHFFGYYRFD